MIKIGVEPNGVNINLDVGSTAPEALEQKVREMRADVGIALDGDADRMIIVDEKGHVVDGDQILAVIAESWQADGRLAKPGIVSTVMANLGLERRLAERGLCLERTAVGDRYVLERMVEKGFNVGGEPSGHIILTDHSTTGDGLVAAMQVLAVVVKQGKPVSEVCRRFDPLPQVLRNVRFKGGRPLEDAFRGQGDRRGDGAARQAGPSGHPPVGDGTRHSRHGRGGRSAPWSTRWSPTSATRWRRRRRERRRAAPGSGAHPKIASPMREFWAFKIDKSPYSAQCRQQPERR